jgi:hypothetical protein
MHKKRSHEKIERNLYSVHTANIKNGMGLSPLVLLPTVPAVPVQ